ncbi:MAG: tRNA (5-methylaminomethyl-2-thiouridine)(34)-methyltransferase MnmD [Bacteroidetes bacterium]|nr:tRNA (5-methylaminomethyl-2-thiouridine)(34)-methyltransferase MnmD [Bacteroidota bacterium]
MEIRKTGDGSDTLWSERYGETYHSSFGAETESTHVFLNAGLNQLSFDPINIFEMGFGTGLNAYLTYQFLINSKPEVIYHAIELNPLSFDIVQNFNNQKSDREVFHKLHQAEWDKDVYLEKWFTLRKIHADLQTWVPEKSYHLIYYDAFSPESQPELWTPEIFQKLFKLTLAGGLLTTYCAKGIVRRNMISAGFKVERIPGPPGKREILRAYKQL